MDSGSLKPWIPNLFTALCAKPKCSKGFEGLNFPWTRIWIALFKTQIWNWWNFFWKQVLTQTKKICLVGLLFSVSSRGPMRMWHRRWFMSWSHTVQTFHTENLARVAEQLIWPEVSCEEFLQGTWVDFTGPRFALVSSCWDFKQGRWSRRITQVGWIFQLKINLKEPLVF